MTDNKAVTLFSSASQRFDINPPWEINSGQFQVTPCQEVRNYIQATGQMNTISTVFLAPYGEWSYKMKRIKDYNEFWPISLNKNRWMWSAKGYLLWTNIQPNGTPYDSSRLKGLVFSRSDVVSGEDLASYQKYSADGKWTNIKIKRDITGLWQIWMDNDLIIQAVDKTYTENKYVHLSIAADGSNGYTDISFKS